ncbi:FAD-binding oxidoreductase [Kribbella sp. CA-293567]|uniref:FAD-binding oxidoreductase n=1 Tax=Kribbella sp. CA-293567 TaxID=3002436 RepID=UPI0022DD397F|nr:FAD-binding oxidoreductase [Kribbella sp. CA-293567]WBQ07922.1 FAD-binding oxidoreductase [Kribbella sp. CA-293567]
MSGTTTEHPGRIQPFRELYDGLVVIPGSELYPSAAAAWNLAADQCPAVVVRPADAQQVQLAVTAAAATGLRVAAQGTGHNAGPLESLQDAVLLRTDLMRDIQIDVAGRTATVGAGVLWEDLIQAAAKHGFTAPHGSAPNVGVVGYLLGGGLSWYGRSLGLAANTVTGLNIVLADGSLVRADAAENAEIFWAVRGGGGNFGVVTSVELELIEVESVYAGMMIWDQTNAETVLRTWRDWTATAPNSVTSTFRLMNFPPLPEIPEFLRGRRVVIIDGAAMTAAALGAELVAPFRALAPELDTFASVPAESLLTLHLDPEGPLPVVSDSAVLTTFGDEALADLLAIAGPSAPPSLFAIELRQLGGALGEPVRGGGAVNHLPGEYLLFAGTVAPTPEAVIEAAAAAHAVVAAVTQHGSEQPYLNFVEHPVDVREAFDPTTWRQLVGIKSAVDPDRIFIANHPIPTLFQNGLPTS